MGPGRVRRVRRRRRDRCLFFARWRRLVSRGFHKYRGARGRFLPHRRRVWPLYLIFPLLHVKKRLPPRGNRRRSGIRVTRQVRDVFRFRRNPFRFCLSRLECVRRGNSGLLSMVGEPQLSSHAPSHPHGGGISRQGQVQIRERSHGRDSFCC